MALPPQAATKVGMAWIAASRRSPSGAIGAALKDETMSKYLPNSWPATANDRQVEGVGVRAWEDVSN